MSTITSLDTGPDVALSVQPRPIDRVRFRLTATDVINFNRTIFLLWDMDRETAELLHKRLGEALLP